ncbi:MAG: acetyl-CoA carboxylase, biotin carboxyl carrier protein, partial [Hyphomicrobiaceae bacterium]
MAKDLKGKGSPEQTLVRELAALLDETGLGEIEIEREGVRVRVARRMAIEAAIGMPAQSAIQQSAAQLAEGAPKKIADDPAKHPGAVKSPMVGTAYLAPEPGAAPFIEVGSRVAQGQTI